MRLHRFFARQLGPDFLPVVWSEVLPSHCAQRGSLDPHAELCARFADSRTDLPQVSGTESKVPREHFSATRLLSEVRFKVHSPMLEALAPPVKSHLVAAHARAFFRPS